MKNKTAKVLAAVVSLGIIVLVVLLGPAEAFILGFTVADDEVSVEEDINFQVSAEIESGEVKNITSFMLMLTGPENISCVFAPDGSAISGCAGIDIDQIDDTPFGYGYSYGYGFLPGFLKFNITIESGLLGPGVYTAKLIANIDDDQVVSAELEVMVSSLLAEIEGCSIRAREGSIFFEGDPFGGKNKLSLNVPLKNAAHNGQGSFESQADERISYKFRILDVTKISNDTMKFNVFGGFRNPDKIKSEEAAMIIYNKTSNMIDIQSPVFGAEDMIIKLAKRC